MARRNGDKELDQLQKLKCENQKLKKENSRLRKLIQRGQADQELLHELVQQKQEEDFAAEAQKAQESKWKCHTCHHGIMKIHLIKRLDGVFYWRICSNPECGHKTKLQRYHKDVEGIKHESEESDD